MRGGLAVELLTDSPDVVFAAGRRVIGGVAYWFPHQGTVNTALLLDVDQANFDNFAVAQPTQRRIGVHALVTF